jgi:hypothetical protein
VDSCTFESNYGYVNTGFSPESVFPENSNKAAGLTANSIPRANARHHVEASQRSRCLFKLVRAKMGIPVQDPVRQFRSTLLHRCRR